VQRKDAEQAEARRLRAEGMSVGGIAKRLGVAKSSVSLWVRDVETPPKPPKRPKYVGRPRTPPAPPDPSEPTRRCGRCQNELPLSAFNRNGDGRQHWCRECFRVYFRERGDKHREQSRAAYKRRRQAGRQIVREHLEAHPCTDCGETEIFVLELDHIRGEKRGAVTHLVAGGARAETVRGELDLCEVVCVNCHRRRTALRAGYFRATGVPPASWTDPTRRNHEYLVDVLRSSGCIDCGERDPVVLEFDHRGAKRGLVTRMATFGLSLATIQREIAVCDVRCANCHRVRTLSSAPCWREADHWALALHDL
jgi:hypothetical protein